ncbi:hypothetical protein LV84_00473 [Algoriphagus ratkowskyi]|uniref:DUF5681 domain-containing protein n=1 Tax=Algoriphagus ratkowskyi TaxID=57028 RepID=A0A2W7RH03_9BACT|nr:hypothetical protein [Algoriphagus ratkowskyi]PZX60203.1 hypothetical protein LV84_00473 [Algoriphagus ratkowskyi]TXD78029.1 hypothetical protein ESW18_08240 [Algoriphagus ratkowskyi]
MPKKGQTNNPAGRPKGISNKANRPLKENVTAFLEKNWVKIERDINKLDPYARVQIYEKLLSFVLPRLKSVDGNISVTQKLDGLTDSQLNNLIDSILNEKQNV